MTKSLLKINFLGDSITEGYGVTSYDKCFTVQIAKRLNCIVNNYGIGGTRIARQKKLSVPSAWDMDFQIRADYMEKDADFVFVFGGTNDYGHGDAHLGNINDNDPYTFYGGLNNLTEKLINIYGKDKICYILPTYRYNPDRKTLPDNLCFYDYVNAMKEVLNKFQVEYIDFYNVLPIPKTLSSEKYTIDGIHLNDKGHEIIADVICDLIIKKSM